MSLITCYLDILEIIKPISKFFEVKGLLPFEVQLVFKYWQLYQHKHDELSVSYLASFCVIDGELNLSLLKAKDRTRNNSGHEHVSIAFENMTDLDENVIHEMIAKKQNDLRSLRVIFEKWFSSFSDPIYQNMKLLDPKHW